MKNKKNKKWFIVLILIIILLIFLIFYLLFGRKKSFTVTFDTVGGTPISNIIVKNNEVIKLPDEPVKEGFKFIGWTDNNGNMITNGTKLTEDITLRALWIDNNAETIVITFDTDGGNEIGSIAMAKDGSIILPVDPIKEGYIFGGWIDENGNIISSNMITINSTTLKTYWIKKNAKTSTITFDTDGGNNIDNILIENDKIIVLPVNPTKDGYVFDGWVDTDGNTITKDTIINKDMTIKAIWKEPYTCPNDCDPIENGSKCVKETTTDMIIVSGCPSGYRMSNGKCTGTRYAANNGSNGWECNNSGDYMYTEEDGFGAMMWCVPTTSVKTGKECPDGYTQDGSICKKIETIDCVAN